MATVTLAKNAVVAKLIDPPREVKSLAISLLSYDVPGGMGWSGKSSFYDTVRNTFPAGFVNVVEAEMRNVGHTVHVVSKPPALPLGPENPIVDSFGNDDPRYDYQMKTLRQVERYGAGIVRVSTGGGKSRIAKLIMARYRRMTLFLTTRSILLYQMDDQLKEIGLNTGQIGDGEMRAVRGVNLGMVQTLVQALQETTLDIEIRAIVKSEHSRKDGNPEISREAVVAAAQKVFERKTARRNAILKFLGLIEVVIGEEAHEAGGASYYEILKHCKNASIRVALTATPFMRSSAEDNMRLMAAFGPLLIDISEEMLISRGILSKPYFKLEDVPPSTLLRKSSPFERAYKLGYTENPNMHEAITRDALKAKTHGLPVLTLVARKAQGDILVKAMKDKGLNFVFLRGENDSSERKQALASLSNGDLDGIIGTTILDVGVDVPSIGLVQLAGGMKAEVALRQRIGRGLRAKKPGPNISFIVDYTCNTATVLRDHARQREGIIRNTPGFVEGIVEELPWHLFET